MSELGDRMKKYESIETSRKLIPNLPIYIRLDGRCFSKFTKDMQKPYDPLMSQTMVNTTRDIVKEFNACIGYTQSDEISLIIKENEFFGDRIFKINSVVSSFTSSAFLLNYIDVFGVHPKHITPISFDCRTINMPSETEAANMILWRVQDATKNAITSAASVFYTHKELMHKNSNEKQDMLFEKYINFKDYPESFKRGVFVRKCFVEKYISDDIYNKIPENKKPESRIVKRSKVKSVQMPIFSKVVNREEVIFNGQEPITYSEE